MVPTSGTARSGLNVTRRWTVLPAAIAVPRLGCCTRMTPEEIAVVPGGGILDGPAVLSFGLTVRGAAPASSADTERSPEAVTGPVKLRSRVADTESVCVSLSPTGTEPSSTGAAWMGALLEGPKA